MRLALRPPRLPAGLVRRLGRHRALPPIGVATVVVAAVTATLLTGTASSAIGLSHHPSTPLAAGAAAAGATSPAPAVSTASRPRGAAPAAGTVRPLGRMEAADVLVVAYHPLGSAAVTAVRNLPGVRAVVTADVGHGTIDGRPAYLMGVDPSTFRGWTPLYTARSDALWQSIARGDTAVSFDMGHEAALPLGGTVPVAAGATRSMRIGAFASVGVGPVDAILSDARARAIGLLPHNALVVSAPSADPVALQRAIEAAVPDAGHVELLREVIVVRDAGEFLTRLQINTAIRAAWSRIGKPYVWGATGPNAFDCSGLVGWAYAQAGISLPRTSEQQWFAGPHVPLSDARPGDLLFWTYDPTDPTNVDHVALYVGNGMMIVAPHTGDYVRYTAVPYDHLAGVVRVDPGLAAQVGGPRFIAG